MSRELFFNRLVLKLRYLLPISLGCGVLMSGCVSLGLAAPPKQADPPQRQLPSSTQEACQLYVLPTSGTPSLGDLEVGYVMRGAQVAICNGQRQLATQVLQGEHDDQLAWKKERIKRNCPWYKFGTCKE